MFKHLFRRSKQDMTSINIPFDKRHKKSAQLRVVHLSKKEKMIKGI